MGSNKGAVKLYRRAVRASLLGLAVNLSLGGVKLAAGLISGAFALVADAVNSLGDSLSSVVALSAMWLAQQPADEEHPYGHTRAETIAAAVVSLIIIASALLVGWEALRRLPVRHALPPVWTLWIAAANVVIKESLYRYKVYVGRRTGSTAVIANAWDHRGDALCSLSVLVGLGVVRWAGLDYIWADEAAALVVAAAIIWTGVMLFRRSASELMDLQAEGALVERIREAAESVPGVRAVETLRVRKTGLEHLADIHIEVDGDLSVADGHLIGHQVKEKLVRQFDSLRDVLVHLEPYPHIHGRVDHYRAGRAPAGEAAADGEGGGRGARGNG